MFWVKDCEGDLINLTGMYRVYICNGAVIAEDARTSWHIFRGAIIECCEFRDRLLTRLEAARCGTGGPTSTGIGSS